MRVRLLAGAAAVAASCSFLGTAQGQVIQLRIDAGHEAAVQRMVLKKNVTGDAKAMTLELKPKKTRTRSKCAAVAAAMAVVGTAAAMVVSMVAADSTGWFHGAAAGVTAAGATRRLGSRRLGLGWSRLGLEPWLGLEPRLGLGMESRLGWRLGLERWRLGPWRLDLDQRRLGLEQWRLG